MNARTFFALFQNELLQDEYRNACMQNYQDSKAFTEAISLLIEKVLSYEGDSTFGHSREYLRIDVTSWRGRSAEIADKAPKGFHPYFWDLEVSVEHENYAYHWMDEVIKLAHIDCPLRVVIGYVPFGTPHNEYIEYVSLALRKLRCKQKRENEFLLLIGNPKTTDSAKYFHYRPYLFDGNVFEPQPDWIQEY